MSGSRYFEIENFIIRKRKAIRDGNVELQSNICIKLAELYTEIGSITEAIDEYNCAAKLLYGLNKYMQYGTVHRMIGEIYATRLNDFEKALDHQSIHKNVARSEKNQVEEQRAFATIGRIHYCAAIFDSEHINKSLLDKALRNYKKSLNICETLSGVSKYELSEMKARLLLNIGNIHEQYGDFQTALAYLMTAKSICESMELFTTLIIILNAMSSLYVREKDTQSALKCLNEAYDVADRLSHGREANLCEILQLKAEIFIQQEDFCATKDTLMKAYKLKTPDRNLRENIERMLKAAALMYYTEKKILALEDEDYKEKKLAYEKLGDGACILKNYTKAIFCYEKMLECVIALNETGFSLSAAYVSLAQTFKDSKNYCMAIDYFQKELVQCIGDSQETITTLINLAETTQLRGDPFENVYAYLEKARQEAQLTESKKIENKVIKRMIHFCRKYKKFDLVKGLINAQKYWNIPDDTSDQSSNETEEVLNEINISNISDSKSEEETQSQMASSSRKRTSTKLKISKNSKGETPLHIACTKGSYTTVENLLNQGHSVNVRDIAGWTPLHEACNYGYLNIVKLLLSHGASINDRGGKYCSGFTPLLDAATNGHLEIVEFLINQEASITAQDNAGRNILDILLEWHKKNVPLSESVESKYNLIVEHLLKKFQCIGWVKGQDSIIQSCSTIEIESCENCSSSTDLDSLNLPSSSGLEKNTSLLRTGKMKINDGSITINDDSSDLSEEFPTVATIFEYQQGLSQNHEEIDPEELENINVNDDQFIENFQLSRIPKRKRFNNDFIQSSSFGTNEGNKRFSMEIENIQEGFEITQNEITIEEIKSQPDYTNIYRVDVHVENMLWIIAVNERQLHNSNIEWLAEEAAKRYYQREGRYPILKLFTKDGRILNNEYPLLLIIDFNELFSETLSWNNPSIEKRYVHQCTELHFEVNQKLFQYLETSIHESVLDFSYLELSREQFMPLLLSLRYDQNVEEVNFGANFLEDEQLMAFFQYLPIISHLKKVNFSSNKITRVGIESAALICAKYTKKNHLSDIDLSFNFLGNESFKDLISLISYFQLETLRLTYCGLNENLEKIISTVNFSCFKNISILDLSENRIGSTVVRKILNGLNQENIKELHLASTITDNGSIVGELVNFFQQKHPSNLEILDISNCRVTDLELLDLIVILQDCDKLNELNLSLNDQLSILSLQNLIAYETFVHTLKLDLCSNIYEGIKDNKDILLKKNIWNGKNNKLQILHTPYSTSSGAIRLNDFWKYLWKEKAIITRFHDSYHFSVDPNP